MRNIGYKVSPENSCGGENMISKLILQWLLCFRNEVAMINVHCKKIRINIYQMTSVSETHEHRINIKEKMFENSLRISTLLRIC